MKKEELVQETLDWFLPSMHEEVFWKQFTKPGRTFLDVGAHVGTYALNLASYFDRIICFEPDPRSCHALRANIELNGFNHIEVVEAAVTNKQGEMEITLYPNPCTNTMMPYGTGRVDENLGTIVVPTLRLGDFVRERKIDDVDFVKIDVEGAEMLVVDGADGLFQKQNPDFLIEMHGLFYDRLKKQLHPIPCDVVDGCIKGINLMRHRDEWPDFQGPEWRVYGPDKSPTSADIKAMRDAAGLPYIYDQNEWQSLRSDELAPPGWA